MIEIRFFASLREQLDCEKITLTEQDITTVEDVLNQLKLRSPQWQAALSTQILFAVNQEMAEPHTQLKSGDEVAFFPPVTGG